MRIQREKSWRRINLSIIGILVFVSFAVRLALLDRYVAPPSGDFGNFLIQSNIILGNDVTGYGLRYPPLFFLMLIPFIKAMGPILALKTVQALVASSSCIPFYFLAQRRMDYFAAASLTLLFTFSQTLAEMTAWGGSPNFLAITFMISCLYFVDLAFSSDLNLKRNALLAGIFAGLVFDTHHLTTTVLGSALVIFLVFMLARNEWHIRIKALKVFAMIGASAAAVGLPVISVYLRMQGDVASGIGSYGLANFDLLFSPRGGGFLYLFSGAYWFAWGFVFLLGGLMIIANLKIKPEDRPFHLLILAAAVAPLILGLLVYGTASGRFLAFLPVPFILGFGSFLMEVRKPGHALGKIPFSQRQRTYVKTAVLALIVVLSATGMQWASGAVDWFHPIERGDMEALDWVKENIPEDTVFATSGKILSGHKEGDRLAWWIMGYCERPTVFAGSEKYRLFRDETESTRDLNRFFAGTHVMENGYFQVSDNYPIEYRGNPEISVRSEKSYEPLFFLNDAMHDLNYYANSSSTTIEHETFNGATLAEMEISTTGDTIESRATLTTAHAELERITRMTYASKSVILEFHITPVNGSILDSLILRFYSPHGNTLSEVETGVQTSFVVGNQWREPAKTDISVVEGADQLTSSHYVEPSGSAWNIAQIVYELSPSGGTIDVMLDVSVEDGEFDDQSSLAYYNGYEILDKYNVEYIFESTSMGLEVQRFSFDSEHFSEVFNNQAVQILRVER